MSAALTLEELAVRCEQASGPDRGLDEAILATTGYEGYLPTPDFTASLDAAMELVPEGWSFGAGWDNIIPGPEGWAWVSHDDDTPMSRAATPALSLCAASLRARANA